MWNCGLILLALALLSFLYVTFLGGPSISEAWYAAHPNSLVGFQGFVDSNIDPDPGDPTLWYDRVLPALETSAFHVAAGILGTIGAITLLLATSRRR